MPAICLNTGFVAYLAELFTTKHFSPNANEYKKQAENAKTPLVVWLCTFNTVLTIMLHFGIKNT